jgi:hypothetical protein
VTRLLTVLAVLVLAHPCLAQYGYPVQTVRDGFSATYTLYSSGNITRDGFFRRELIDNGTGTKMIAAGSGSLFCLKNNGNIWMYRGSGMNWIQIDNGTGTSRIWVQYGRCYCQKNNGQIWTCVDPYRGQWQPLNGPRSVTRVGNYDAINGK